MRAIPLGTTDLFSEVQDSPNLHEDSPGRRPRARPRRHAEDSNQLIRLVIPQGLMKARGSSVPLASDDAESIDYPRNFDLGSAAISLKIGCRSEGTDSPLIRPSRRQD